MSLSTEVRTRSFVHFPAAPRAVSISCLLVAAACLTSAAATPSLEALIAAHPDETRAAVIAALQPPPTVDAKRASDVVEQAIRALGDAPRSKQIATIVTTAIQTVPDQVLEIVYTAALVSPAEAAGDIAVAAVNAVADPWKRVVYIPHTNRTRASSSDFKGEPDFKDSKAVVPMAAPAVPASGTPVILAEAIIQAVAEAQPGLSPAGLFATVNGVLRLSPGYLMSIINDPTGISGVGDAGNNNYANEPGRRRPPSLPPRRSSGPSATPIPVRFPTPAPVSQ